MPTVPTAPKTVMPLETVLTTPQSEPENLTSSKEKPKNKKAKEGNYIQQDLCIV